MFKQSNRESGDGTDGPKEKPNDEISQRRCIR